MVTRAIFRADDITGDRIERLAAWFQRHHLDVPCSAFAMATDREWTEESWELAATLVSEYDWEIGGHSLTHPILSAASEAEIRREVGTNKDHIEAGIASVGTDYRVKSFAYPTGSYDERVIEVLKETGYECGLTYPDGFPYRSTRVIPEGDDRYRWGITHNAFLGLPEWNDRFDRVHGTDETGDDDTVYVLSFHPQWWWDTSDEPNSVGLDLERGWVTEEWAKLDEHIRYLKDKDDVVFTTYHECLETAGGY